MGTGLMIPLLVLKALIQCRCNSHIAQNPCMRPEGGRERGREGRGREEGREGGKEEGGKEEGGRKGRNFKRAKGREGEWR